ncbi:hypothetical protein DFH28DRAFT_25108 [Melampsora americana]|nr:hypothetical protein DFH28DRAFT_25108 [Melampsora americana]
MTVIILHFYLALFAFNYVNSLTPQCDAAGSAHSRLDQQHCDPVLASFVNYGNWVLSPRPVASQSCRSCEVSLQPCGHSVRFSLTLS